MRPRLLIVSADLGLYAALAVLLATRFRIDVAVTAEEPLAALGAGPLAFAILDAASLGPAAAHVSRFLKARHPSCTVIAILISADAAALAAWADSPVDAVFTKPYTFPAVLQYLAGPAGPGHLALGRMRPPGRYISRAVDYLAQNYATAGRIKALAKTLGISRGRLAYLFKRETGLTVREYRTRVRIAVAKRLLEGTDAKLDAIAQEVGFCDASHISRVFVAHVGRRPGEYRRQCHGAGEDGAAAETPAVAG